MPRQIAEPEYRINEHFLLATMVTPMASTVPGRGFHPRAVSPTNIRDKANPEASASEAPIGIHSTAASVRDDEGEKC